MFNDPSQISETVELIWNTGAHGAIIAEDMLSAKSNKTLHSRYTIQTEIRRA